MYTLYIWRERLLNNIFLSPVVDIVMLTHTHWCNILFAGLLWFSHRGKVAASSRSWAGCYFFWVCGLCVARVVLCAVFCNFFYVVCCSKLLTFFFIDLCYFCFWGYLIGQGCQILVVLFSKAMAHLKLWILEFIQILILIS